MKLSRLLEKITALAKTGLNYSSELPHHKETYQLIYELCVNFTENNNKDVPMTTSSEQWRGIIRELGVITPKVGSVVAITRSDGAILVLERPNHHWCLPCGYAEIGETPESAALREAYEETGLEIQLRYFLGIETTLEDVNLPFMWEAVYVGEIQSASVRISHEHLSAEWIKSKDDRLWHSTHEGHVERALEFLNSGNRSTVIEIVSN